MRGRRRLPPVIRCFRNESVQDTPSNPRGLRRRSVTLAKAPMAKLCELQTLALGWWRRSGYQARPFASFTTRAWPLPRCVGCGGLLHEGRCRA